jgi:undecaprenyl-diphosphatase
MSHRIQRLNVGSEKPHRSRQSASRKICCHQIFHRLDSHEIRFVRLMVHKSQHPVLQSATKLLNCLGNGWLYGVIGTFLLIGKGMQVWRPILAALVSVALTHLLYHWIKSYLARVRPCDSDPTLRTTVKALDKYSCPSGHCMTATAVGIPVALAFPVAALAVLSMWLLIAWSRLSSGHHYPTDLILGLTIGACIALPVSMMLI